MSGHALNFGAEKNLGRTILGPSKVWQDEILVFTLTEMALNSPVMISCREFSCTSDALVLMNFLRYLDKTHPSKRNIIGNEGIGPHSLDHRMPTFFDLKDVFIDKLRLDVAPFASD